MFRKKKGEKFVKVLEYKKRPLRQRLQEIRDKLQRAYGKFEKYQVELGKRGGQILEGIAKVKTGEVPREYLPEMVWYCDNCKRSVKTTLPLPGATCRVCGRLMRRVK